MDERILDPDGARERLAAWKGRIDKLADDTMSMSRQLQGLRIVAEDPKGIARVTIDSTGTMVNLRLTDRMSGQVPDTVAATIMSTLADARKQLAERSREIVADTIGTETAAGRAIVESVGRQLGADEPKPVRRPAGDDDDNTAQVYTEERW
ncbi:YbaB/EbfC family nucleoid-associated protein [Lentzea sp.]|uniref:YbaB/EbfC family nucleoid-associated protein n=1 Tax=Lentzea sp. TaxID=56099 RepID=UPI002C61AB86|nr:YbaB/EbfC family nucleoid-associated protein [Lentzea sp.]HUQ55839.1 YbaB/EbfC family nucleoid-associated protein [Lentzea sp.]